MKAVTPEFRKTVQADYANKAISNQGAVERATVTMSLWKADRRLIKSKSTSDMCRWNTFTCPATAIDTIRLQGPMNTTERYLPAKKNQDSKWQSMNNKTAKTALVSRI